MTDNDMKLIIDLALDRIDKVAFWKNYSVVVDDVHRHVIELIEEAANKKDADRLECAMIFGATFGFPQDVDTVLCDLILEDWHRQHEDIVFDCLRHHNSPRVVDYLYRASKMRLPYLAYNESGSLGSKAVYALVKIGTEEALEKVREIAATDNRPMVQEAIRISMARKNGQDV